MEKEWMSMNRLSQEYAIGVETFLNFALKNANDANSIPCPCTKCGNASKTEVAIIRAHLMCNGIDLTYKRWIWHGEKIQTRNNDNVGPSDAKCSLEEPLDMIRDAYDAYKDNPSDFQKLLEDAQKPLYFGSKFTKLATTVKLYNLKAKYSWSDTSFNDLLSLIKEMLPENNELPTSLYDAKKSLSTLGIDYEKIHACPNDCILYRREYTDLSDCPTCGSSRWKVAKNNKLLIGVPAKVLWYFPPIPRFLRMFRTKEISKDLTWHANSRMCDGNLRHPADAPAWKLVDNKWPDFGAEPRNLRLALAADGINPHSLMNCKYSCWPVVLVTYNLPPWLCMKRKFMMLTLLISGPKQPGNDIDVYLAPLVDDLKKLWDVGIQAYDAYNDESFMLRCVLLWTINDFPAYGNLSGCSVKGYKACPICAENTHSKWLGHSRKISYTGHRKFLPKRHPFRKQKKAFDGLQEFGDAPKPLNGHDILKKMDDINYVWGKVKSKSVRVNKLFSRKRKKKESTTPSQENSCFKKKSIFFELEYWKHLHIRHILDVMHIEKNVLESLLGTLLDIPGKTKDGIAARMDLVDMGLKSELRPTVVGKRTFLPPACYTLSKEEKTKVCNSFLGMKVPEGFSSNVSTLVSMKDLKLTGLKSHDCHILMQQLLPVAIRGVLPKHVRIAITRLCHFFNEICNKVIDVPKLEEIQKEVVITLCLLEKYFPPSFFDIMVHLIVHLVREVKLCGPVWYRWMYPFERFMKILKGYVRNRNRLEGCIAECYVAEEAIEFCSEYLCNVHTIGIPSTNLEIDLTRPMSQSKVTTITNEEWEQAHRYVVTNDDDIDSYIKEHKEHLLQMYPKKVNLHKWLQDKHNQSFTSWLRERVFKASVNSDYVLPEKLKWLFYGPSKQVLEYSSYKIDGVIFSTKERDEHRVFQNSGVRVNANVMQVASAKDKNPIVADMTFYGRIEKIWELDYHIFRVVVFKCIWVDNNNGVQDDSGLTLVNLKKMGYKSDPFILGNQAKQVFYIEDPQDHEWSVELDSPSKRYRDVITRDDFGDTSVQLQCFSKEVPRIDTNNELDEHEPPCVREDCDGIWVKNNNL